MKHLSKNSKIEYIIEYAGLPVGEHEFEFDITDEFMRQYSENTYENNIRIQACIILIKHNHALQAKVKLQGNISVICDRCLIPYSYPIETEATLLIQKGHPENSTDEILMVEDNDNKINFSQYLYETISLALPYKIVPCEVFENVKCDEQVLEKMQKNLPDENKFTTFADLIKNKLKP
ncbi:MAG: hypothetical protein KatS3mg028_0385 [Bacteroidia bacterium]|nr:MAG: hypothetical protein KatS3mg028_0385 [Bacteroidia bacterium]